MSRNFGAGKRRAFTLIELLVVIATIALLAAILFPVFSMVRDRARGTACMSNQRQIGIALTMYLNDKGEKFPPYIVGEHAAYYGTTPASPEERAWTMIERVPGQDPPEVPADLFAMNTEMVNNRPDAPGPPSTEPVSHYRTWMDCIFPYAKSLKLFICPSHNQNVIDLEKVAWNGAPEYYWVDNNKYMLPSLATNMAIMRQNLTVSGKAYIPPTLSEFVDVSQKIMFFHNKSGINNYQPSTMFTRSTDAYRDSPSDTSRRNTVRNHWPHQDGSTVTFADGHVKWLSRKSWARYTCQQPYTFSNEWTGGTIPANVVGRYGCGYWTPEVKAPA